MTFVIIILLIIIVVPFSILQRENHESRIQAEVESIGGEVLSIEKKIFSTGPFIMVGKGRTVYRIEYKLNGELKEGWVRFGGLMGPDWRL